MPIRAGMRTLYSIRRRNADDIGLGILGRDPVYDDGVEEDV